MNKLKYKIFSSVLLMGIKRHLTSEEIATYLKEKMDFSEREIIKYSKFFAAEHQKKN